MLVELTARFKEQFGEAKREKNILDFTDMEHFALQILMTKAREESICLRLQESSPQSMMKSWWMNIRTVT